MIDLAQVARMISNKKDSVLIWGIKDGYDIISDGCWVVRSNKEKPKSLINKLVRKFGDQKPTEGEVLIYRGERVKSDSNIFKTISDMCKDSPQKELIDTHLTFRTSDANLNCIVLHNKLDNEYVYIDENFFKMSNEPNYLYGGSRLDPVFISRNKDVDWHVLILTVRIMPDAEPYYLKSVEV